MKDAFSRRQALGLAGGAAGAAGTFALLGGNTATAGRVKYEDFEVRGTVGSLERLRTLDLESYDEFSTSTRAWVNGELTRIVRKRADEICRANGIDPRAEISMETALELLADDPVIMFRYAAWHRGQRHMWQVLKREFHDHYDIYMSEMESADKAGPGVLELNPGIEPEYAKHEIHMQPGGYTGDPFAGHMYHYGTNNFYMGHNHQDEVHTALAADLPIPEDGKVRRILDAGCSCGQLTVALKKRFPDAEVWGVDIGAPMVRYAHLRAVDLGVDVNFRHALAEDTGFPDGYFDIVTSYILHHEVPEQATYNIIGESERLLRPGGVYYPVDTHTTLRGRRGEKTAIGRLGSWFIHRWNHERWNQEYRKADFFGEMRRVGLILNKDGPSATIYPAPGSTIDNIVGVKPA